MHNDLPIQPMVDERPDRERRTITYPVDLCRHLRSQHWSTASKVYSLNVRIFTELADDLRYTDRGKRLCEKMASLN